MTTYLKSIRKSVKNWYLPVIVGVLFVLLGIYFLRVPAATYLTLVMFFSFSFVFAGVLEIVFSLRNKEELEGWGWYLASGLFSLVLGLILVFNPVIAATSLPLVVGFTLLFRCFHGAGYAFELKNYGAPWGAMLAVNILGIILSFILIFNPVITGLSIVVVTAFNFILAGIAAVLLGFQLKKLKAQV